MYELIARLMEVAEGGRKLDALIAEMHDHPANLPGYPMHYTTSLDAAVRLLPPGRTLWSVCDMEDGPIAHVVRPMPDGGYVGGLSQGRAATPALALCAAALKARGGFSD